MLPIGGYDFYALTLTFPASSRDSATLRIAGRTSISSRSGNRIPGADFVVDVGLQGPAAGTVTLISAQPGSELSYRGKFDEPTVDGVRVLKDIHPTADCAWQVVWTVLLC